MQGVTVKGLTQLTGINGYLWRAAMKRYELFKPVEKKGRLYFYTNEQLALLLKLAFLFTAGFTLQELIVISEEEVDGLVHLQMPFALPGSCSLLLLGAGLRFKESHFTKLLEACIDVFGLEETINATVDAYLQKLDLLSYAQNDLAMQRPFAIPVICQQIILCTTYLPEVFSGTKVILFTKNMQDTEIKALFINYLLRKRGCTVIYLEAGTGLTDLKKIYSKEKADWLWLYSPEQTDTFTADTYLENLVRRMPGCRIVATGAGIQKVSRHFLAVTLLRKDGDIYNFIENVLR